MKIFESKFKNFKELKELEKKLDNMFSSIKVDVEFSGHFKKRILERRIEREELIETFKKLYLKFGSKLNRDHYAALVVDVFSFLNIPIVVEWEKDEFKLTPKTVVKTEKHLPARGADVLEV